MHENERNLPPGAFLHAKDSFKNLNTYEVDMKLHVIEKSFGKKQCKIYNSL